MAQFAQYDSTLTGAPAPVTGWYDTGLFAYAALPPQADLFPVTPAQWVTRLANPSGWAVSGGALVPYTPPAKAMTPAQLAQAAFAAGVQITSTATPTLNGTYSLSESSLSRITAEQVYIATTGKFTNGQTTRSWLDAAGAAHIFPSTAAFTAFAEAVAQYEDALIAAQAVVQAGSAWVAPAQPAPLP